MPLTELQAAAVRHVLAPFRNLDAPPHVRAKLRVDFRIKGNEAILFESRPRFQNPAIWQEAPVAKFRYVRTRQRWELFCQHSDLKWHCYNNLPYSPDLALLAAEVDRDPTGIFWG